MARLKDIPMSAVNEVLGGVRASRARREECVRVAVMLEPDVDPGLARCLKEALMPQGPTGLVHVELLSGGAPLRVNPDTDLAVVACGSLGPSAGQALAALSRAGVACVAVGAGAEDMREASLPQDVVRLASEDLDLVMDSLAAWMSQVCAKDIALARNFPFTRSHVASRCIRGKAAINAVTGLVPFGSTADLPVLCANQALMALDIMSLYGRGLDAGVLWRLAAIVAGGVGSRQAARKASRALPGLGWAVRGGVAWGTTFGLGLALKAVEGHLAKNEADGFV